MKILLYAIVAVAALAVAVLFSVQNASPVTVWFYNWQFTTKLAIVVFLSMIAGAAIMSLLFLAVQFTRSLRRRTLARASRKEEAKTSPGGGIAQGQVSEAAEASNTEASVPTASAGTPKSL
jgi:uncharacterized integral membrane protein